MVHLREDRRHAQVRDLEVLRKTVQTKLNMEMAPTNAMVNIAKKIKPEMATLVPEKRQELTTEGGLNVVKHFKKVKSTVEALKKGKILVSLFIDPDPKQIEKSHETGAQMVEIHTGTYADALTESAREKELIKIENAVDYALDIGLRVSAGHGLNYFNVEEIAFIEGIEELNIGHSLISRALLVGMDTAVRDMVVLCGE